PLLRVRAGAGADLRDPARRRLSAHPHDDRHRDRARSPLQDGLRLAVPRVETIGPVPVLTDATRRRLHGELFETDLFREVLPPDRFVFRGFTIFRAIEVTDQEVLSSLERDLIDKESIVSHTRFNEV